jgi:hypothetical protein
MMTTSREHLAGSPHSGREKQRKAGPAAESTTHIFREAMKVRQLRKRKTQMGDGEPVVDAPVDQELVADHEWDALLHAFDTEPGELPPGDGVDEHDALWERLSSTRWLKQTPPDAPASETATSSSETGASAPETGTSGEETPPAESPDAGIH